jgi:hypothetical protein
MVFARNIKSQPKGKKGLLVRATEISQPRERGQ